MTILESIVLGIVQGSTEFLPVSSSGHLVIAQHLLGLKHPPVLFDIILHTGSLAAIIIFFADRLRNLNLFQITLAVLGTLPAVVVGLLVQPHLNSIFSSLFITAIGLMTTGLLLSSTYFLPKTISTSPLLIKHSLLIGLIQSLAIIPGLSRSGSTVTLGLWLKLKKEDAFYFSFLLSIPAITGALVLQLVNNPSFNQVDETGFIFGFFTSLVVSLLSLKILKYVITQNKLHFFAAYCFAVALSLFWYLS